ncbi:hypothetical protein CAP35_11695 [Chitinophagaceae bacterium IBVUCB1]|nr:hypothetical protein CAP35_11695 [Chitinophagaceae bacterium IBVUCB1]
MKRLFIGSLLTLGLAATLASCNNGAYDANPNTDLQGVLNPLGDTTGKGPIVYIGTMKGLVNGGELIFSPAYYTVDTNGVRRIYAWVMNDTVYWRSIEMFVLDSVVKGKKDANLPLAYTFTYSVFDTVRKVHKKYTNSPIQPNDFTVYIASQENNTMRGKFFGSIKNTAPILPPPNPNDVVTFKDLVFYLESKPFKK